MTASSAGITSHEASRATVQGRLHALRGERTDGASSIEGAPGDAAALFASVFGAQLGSVVSSSQMMRAGAAMGVERDALADRAASTPAKTVSGGLMSAGERASASLTEAAEGRAIVEPRETPGPRVASPGSDRAHAGGDRVSVSAPSRGEPSRGGAIESAPMSTLSGVSGERGRAETPNETGVSQVAAPPRTGGAPAGASAGAPVSAAASVGGASAARGGAGASAPPPASGMPNAIAAPGRTDGARPGPTIAPKPGAPTPSRSQEAQLAAQVQRGLFAALRQQGGSVTMRLAPDALGAMTVRLSVQGARVQATFEPTNEQAQRLLERSVETLRAALESKGLSVERITVQPAWNAGGRASEAGPGPEQGSSGGDGARGRETGGDDGDASARSGGGREDPGSHPAERRARVTDDAGDAPTDGAAEPGRLGEDRGGAPGSTTRNGGAGTRLDRVV